MPTHILLLVNVVASSVFLTSASTGISRSINSFQVFKFEPFFIMISQVSLFVRIFIYIDTEASGGSLSLFF